MDGLYSTVGEGGGGDQYVTDVRLEESLAHRGASRGITSGWESSPL